jgi:hypothetical protein
VLYCIHLRLDKVILCFNFFLPQFLLIQMLPRGLWVFRRLKFIGSDIMSYICKSFSMFAIWGAID